MRHSPGRRAFLAGLGGLAIATRPARAAPAARINVGYTATSGFLGAFIAQEKGIFAAHDLDVTLTLIALNATIPSALLGGSIDIGGPTPTVLLQANDNGLDLVVVSGCNATDRTDKNDGVLARTGSGIQAPKDLLGKRVGVPGLGAFIHVLTRKWLSDHGVDWRKVQFVETPFTQMNDLLRAGQVDAVATGDPMYSRIVDQKTGYFIGAYVAGTPLGLPGLLYASTRGWATAHRPEIARFHAAIVEANAFERAQPDEARVIMTKYIKLPEALAKSVVLPQLQSDVTTEQLDFWVTVMTQQEMLQQKPDLAGLVMR